MKNLQVCSFCRNTGKNGAQFVLCIGTEEVRVHKHCGEVLQQQAPKDATVKLIHWAELRREKEKARKQSEQESVRAFWAEKFAAAKPIRKNPAPAALAAE